MQRFSGLGCGWISGYLSQSITSLFYIYIDPMNVINSIKLIAKVLNMRSQKFNLRINFSFFILYTQHESRYFVLLRICSHQLKSVCVGVVYCWIIQDLRLFTTYEVCKRMRRIIRKVFLKKYYGSRNKINYCLVNCPTERLLYKQYKERQNQCRGSNYVHIIKS